VVVVAILQNIKRKVHKGTPSRLYMDGDDGYHPIVELLDECDCCNLYTSEELQDYEIVEMGLDLCTCE